MKKYICIRECCYKRRVWAAKELGINLDGRKTKEDMILAVVKVVEDQNIPAMAIPGLVAEAAEK